MQTEGGTGHPGFICHRQPVLEKHIRQSMAKNGHSDLRVQSTVLSISEDEDWVYVNYTDKDGQEHRIKGRFLVGADGKDWVHAKMLPGAARHSNGYSSPGSHSHTHQLCP